MGKLAAIYARVSSERQKDEKTIDSQTSLLKEYAGENDYTVPSAWVLEDEGYSGSMLARPGLERLRDLASEGKLDAVLIYAPDRLSRRYAYQVLLVEELQRNGVETVFLKSVQGDSPEDKLLQQFQGMIAEYERAQIIERTRRGKRHKAKAGCVNVLCGAPYGYHYIKKTEHTDAYYEICEPEAAVVKEIFNLYIHEWKSMGEISRHLTEKAIPTRMKKKQWDRSVIWAILRNPAYTGRAAYGKTEQCERKKITRPLRQKGGYSPRSGARKDRPKNEWISINVPPLISQEIFDLAQERLKHNKEHASRNTKEPTLLQGMLVCKDCGYAYYRTSTRTSLRKIYYYRCLGSDDYRYPDGRKCKSFPIRQDYLDNLVWKHVIHLLENEELIRDEIQRRIKESKNTDLTQKQQNNLQAGLNKVHNGIDRLLDAYQEGMLPIEELRNRIGNLRKKEATLTKELNALKFKYIEQQRLSQIETSVSSFIGCLKERAKNLNIEEKQKVVRLLLKDILIGKDTITVNHSIPILKKNLSEENNGYRLCLGSQSCSLRCQEALRKRPG
ncbi:MAG: recombinase family protein [Victivallaceae bacterium]|nr:recombinase family protein [Victivallaceae bacterium]